MAWAVAISNLATMLLTAWILHREKIGKSPIPSLPQKIEPQTPDEAEEPQRGRPVL